MSFYYQTPKYRPSISCLSVLYFTQQISLLIFGKVIEDEITYNKLGRYLAKECSGAEARHVESVMCENPELGVLVADLRRLWAAKVTFLPRWDTETSWHELDELIEEAGAQVLPKH